MKKTCFYCAWWGEKSEDPGFRMCGSPKCRNDYLADKDSFGCRNGEPMNGGVVTTGPDFGCIHYEPKDYGTT